MTDRLLRRAIPALTGSMSNPFQIPGPNGGRNFGQNLGQNRRISAPRRDQVTPGVVATAKQWRVIAIGAFVSASLATSPAFACKVKRKGWDTASTVGEIGLMVTAAGMPVLKKDWKGLKQAAFSLGANEVVTEVLKRSFREKRPDCSDHRSFPSGHTSRSFASAFTLQQRYGWKYGAPALVVATFVGAARVAAHKHHWWDSVTGAAIGSGAAILLTKRYRSGREVALVPWVDHKGAGASLSVRF